MDEKIPEKLFSIETIIRGDLTEHTDRKDEESSSYDHENALSYLSQIVQELLPKLQKRSRKKHKQPKRSYKKQPPKVRLYRILPQANYDMPMRTQDTEELFNSYHSSEHHSDLEKYLENVEERESLRLLGTGRADLRSQRGYGRPLAAMIRKNGGAYVAIDRDFERHVSAFERGSRYLAPEELNLTDRLQAIQEYLMDHERWHRSQKEQFNKGVSEVELERDVEQGLQRFYAHQLRKYQNDPKMLAKYAYMYSIARKRDLMVEENYLPDRAVYRRGALRPQQN